MARFGRAGARLGEWAERRMQVRDPGKRRAWPFRRHPLRLIPGEALVQQVPHHWIAYSWAFLELVLAVLLTGIIIWAMPVDSVWLPVVIGGGVAGHALYRMLDVYRDCFYVTNSRVLRESGVFTRQVATMPIGRVLDVAVELPFTLRPWKVGNLVIETAAQEQALRKITLIQDPERTSNVIHQVRQTPAPPPPVQITVEGRKMPDHPRLPRRPTARRRPPR